VLQVFNDQDFSKNGKTIFPKKHFPACIFPKKIGDRVGYNQYFFSGKCIQEKVHLGKLVQLLSQFTQKAYQGRAISGRHMDLMLGP